LPGTLIVIGGSEDKRGPRTILRAVARAADGERNEHRLIVATTATEWPEAAAATYTSLFAELGVGRVDHLDIGTREQAYDERALRLLAGAPVVFFTGGNQLRITSHLGGTPVMRRIRAIYDAGGTIAGTSAGAVALGEHMPFEHLPFAGGMDVTQAASSFRVLPGIGLLPGTIVDSHFAQRGRMWRLLAALARYPGALTIGIDEDAAIHVTGGEGFTVLGSGNVYVVDGSALTEGGEEDAEEEAETLAPRIVSMRDTTLHVLAAGDRFSLPTRQPALARESDAGICAAG
jgi:cyanophycinase